MSAGSSATSTSTACATHPKWALPRSKAFLTHLAVKENVAASTQNQALSALLFLCREVLHQDLGPIDARRAKRPKRLPTVLTREETLRLIACLSGMHQLMAKLIYGSGVRLMECLRLRVRDLEFERRAIIVRDSKRARERVTVLPDSLVPLLQEHLQRVKALRGKPSMLQRAALLRGYSVPGEKCDRGQRCYSELSPDTRVAPNLRRMENPGCMSHCSAGAQRAQQTGLRAWVLPAAGPAADSRIMARSGLSAARHRQHRAQNLDHATARRRQPPHPGRVCSRG